MQEVRQPALASYRHPMFFSVVEGTSNTTGVSTGNGGRGNGSMFKGGGQANEAAQRPHLLLRTSPAGVHSPGSHFARTEFREMKVGAALVQTNTPEKLSASVIEVEGSLRSL
jgi:hypothetical protein